MSLVIRSTTGTTNAALPLLKRDPLLRTDYNNGGRFVFDLALPYCYGGASPVADSAVVKDLADRADGRFVVTAGQAPTFSGGGVDFTPLTARGAYLEMPASAAKTIYDNGQKFLFCVYAKMPADADWNTATSDLPLVSFAIAANGWQGGPDLLQFGMATSGSTKQFFGRRQTAVGTAESFAFTAPPSMIGSFCQIAMWRSATEQGMRIRTAAGTFSATPKAVGSDNTADFSGNKGIIGVGPVYWSAALPSPQLAAKKFKIYRGFLDALALSGNDPVTVLDADWARVIARGAFS